MERLSKLELFSPEKRSLGVQDSGDFIHVYKFLVGECEKDEARFFSVVPTDRVRGSGHRLKCRKFH